MVAACDANAGSRPRRTVPRSSAPTSSRTVSHAPFYTRYGISRTGLPDTPLRIDAYPEVRRHGRLRATVLAAAVDIVGSLFTRAHAGTDVLYTTDLSLRLSDPEPPGSILARGRLLRSGRTGVTTAVELCPAEHPDRVWGYGETGFARIPRAPSDEITQAKLALPQVFASNPLTRPLDEEVGIAVLDAEAGIVELPLRPAVLNAEATLQGALVALLFERAAEVMAETRLGRPQRVVALDLRYLATAKAGPIRSRSRFLGPPDEGVIQIELFDRGREERVTATALLRVAPAR